MESLTSKLPCEFQRLLHPRVFALREAVGTVKENIYLSTDEDRIWFHKVQVD